MSILSDATITALCTDSTFADKPMISPFSGQLIRAIGDTKIISKGITSYGYDVALAADECFVFTNHSGAVIDPKRFDADKSLVKMEVQTDEDGSLFVVLPANSYMLGRTVEWMEIPRDVMVVAVGKSTYARSAVIVNTTPIEPGFSGNVVIELSNASNCPVRIYLNEGIAQFLFFKGDMPCCVSYSDRAGKYQGQCGVVMARV